MSNNTTTRNKQRGNRISAIWRDIRTGQRRLDAINRPWAYRTR